MSEEIDPKDRCPSAPEKVHCLCAPASAQHAMMRHADRRCCWCGGAQCIYYDAIPVPGHGPYRSELVQRQ